MLDTLHSKPAESLRGTIQVAGDKSISHRALMFAALAEGVSEINNFLEGADCFATMRALTWLGVRIEVADGLVRVHGCSGQFRLVEQPIYSGNSGTSID